MSITLFVVSGAGFGLVNIMRANQIAEGDSARLTNLNRALNFIANDVRESYDVSTSVPASWIPSTCYAGVLYLSQPTGTPGGDQVAYYTRPEFPPTGVTCSTVLWQGPQLIYRYAGNTGPTNVSQLNVLIDSISQSGFTPTITSGRQLALVLKAQSCVPSTLTNECSSPSIKSTKVKATTFTRAACAIVPNLAGQTLANAQILWNNAAFATTVSSSGAGTVVNTQSLLANSCHSSTSPITVTFTLP